MALEGQIGVMRHLREVGDRRQHEVMQAIRRIESAVPLRFVVVERAFAAHSARCPPKVIVDPKAEGASIPNSQTKAGSASAH